MKHKYLIKIASYIIIILIFTDCQKKNNYFKDYKKITIEIERFDEDIINLTNKNEIFGDIRNMYKKYETFMPFFVENIIGIPTKDTMYLCNQLLLFLNDTTYGFKITNQKVLNTFKDITPIKREIEDAFSKSQNLFDNFIKPKIYFYISGFNSSITFINNDIGVGVDMYLGKDYPYYNKVVYDYQKQNMEKESIAVDVVSAYLFKNIPMKSKKNRIIDNIIYRGKIMFILTQIFNNKTEDEIIGYTKKQINWCKKYEKDIWDFIIDRKELFQAVNPKNNFYLKDGPFTSEISQNCPARIGTWVGLQIVKNYMENNNISIRHLINDWDSENILYNSKYRPL